MKHTKISDSLARIAMACIRFYRRGISPLLGNHCRFTPTCSEYALQAIEYYGVWRGSWLALCRIGRCHPFHRGGYDPVPESTHKELVH